jgi:hypothetical protein
MMQFIKHNSKSDTMQFIKQNSKSDTMHPPQSWFGVGARCAGSRDEI